MQSVWPSCCILLVGTSEVEIMIPYISNRKKDEVPQLECIDLTHAHIPLNWEMHPA